jgi:hypothetical protein
LLFLPTAVVALLTVPPAAAVSAPAAAKTRDGGVRLDEPVRVATVKANRDKTRIVGHVVAYDATGFRVLTPKGKTVNVRWDELAAAQLYGVRRSVLDPRDAAGFVALGRELLRREDGQRWAQNAFAQAQRVDPAVRDQVAEAKGEVREKLDAERRNRNARRVATKDDLKGVPPKAKRVAPPEPATREGDNPSPGDSQHQHPADPEGGDDVGDEAEEPADAEADADAGTDAAVGLLRHGHARPHGRGDQENEEDDDPPRFRDQKPRWPKLDLEEQADEVDQLNLFAREAARTLDRPLRLRETKFFLFYSDLPQNEADRWAGLLDKMYDRLSELFETGKGVNIWKGKALVFVFASAQDYRRFQVKMHDTNPGKSVGMCHSFDDGSVHIAFYRQPNERTFAHVLVHESVHGFLHRYRSPAWLPGWVNEGLAEVIAAELVHQPVRAESRPNTARAGFLGHRGFGGLMNKEALEAWQYPVAETLCAYMIRQSQDRFVDFINGIKDGLPWEESLEKRYGVTRERLIRGYGESLGVKGLKE